MANVIEQEIAEFVQAVSDARICAYCDVAALTWLMYDTVTSLPRERKYMWRAKNSVPKFLYLILRYFTPLDLAFTVAIDTNYHIKYNGPLCHGLLWYKALISLFVPSFIAEALMMMRIYALYGRKRKVLYAVCVLYTVRVLFPIWAAFEETLPINVLVYDYDVPMPGCAYSSPERMYANLIASSFDLTISVILFGLTMYKFLLNAAAERRELSLERIRDVRRNAPLMPLFMRDGSMYFALAAASEVVFLALIFTFKGRGLQLAGYPWVATIYTIAGTRVTLNLRSTPLSASENGSAGTEMLTRTEQKVSALVFARSPVANASLATGADSLSALDMRYARAGRDDVESNEVDEDEGHDGEDMDDGGVEGRRDDPSLLFASRSEAEALARASVSRLRPDDSVHVV